MAGSRSREKALNVHLSDLLGSSNSMAEQHRTILNRHWKLLTTYLSTTDELIKTLVDEKVLPSSMADDIRAGKTSEDRNDRLLTSVKLRGNASFRKFRQVLSKMGQFFIVEMLWDDDKSYCFIEETDFESYPSFKTSLSFLEQKQLIWSLDAKIKSRLLRSEWRNNSEERLKKLQVKMEEDNEVHSEDYNKTIIKLRAEVASKNETLRSIVRDYNELNDDVMNFLKRHQTNTRALASKTLERGDSGSCNGRVGGNGTSSNVLSMLDSEVLRNSRFKMVDQGLSDMAQRISSILEEPVVSMEEEIKFDSIKDVANKFDRLETLVKDLKTSVATQSSEKYQVRSLLGVREEEEAVNEATSGASLMSTIRGYLAKQQNRRSSLLSDINHLSKTLRNIHDVDENSGLVGLRQSAVTGDPKPEVIDFRFLRNHIALLNADAEHLTKKIAWKEEEIHSLKMEMFELKLQEPKISSKHQRLPAFSP